LAKVRPFNGPGVIWVTGLEGFRKILGGKKAGDFFGGHFFALIFALLYTEPVSGEREFSSAGSEHLPYKQRVGGSNPSTPTTKDFDRSRSFAF
jgi:hypothetical protein